VRLWNVPRYRTEIVVAADRYVCLQLPPHFPEGVATVTVRFHGPPDADRPDSAEELDPDREDIEWWEEFEEGDAEPVV
jgi:hypothetical protein